MVFARGGCVYIMTNMTHSVLYTGVTSDIIGRVWDHKNKTYPKSFTAKYNCDKLVYYFFYAHIEEAIAAEKAIKGGSREYKKQLVHSINPEWKDLYDGLIAEDNN
jgi:putative endonuclease